MRYAVIGQGGIIEQTGQCTPGTLDLQGGDLLAVEAPEHVTDASHYWNGTNFAEYPARPGSWAEWHGTEWIDPRDGAQVQADLDRARSEARSKVDDWRGDARLAFITDIPGQDALYIAKFEEARGFVAALDSGQQIDMSDYPLVLSEVGVTAGSAYEVAQVFLNLNAIWRQANCQIDAICFQAKNTLLQAPDEAAITSILAALNADLNAVSPVLAG
ncbi:hypothetical protein [Paracoccus sp. (in: a-proteobacteria)]|uniref:hypothetical protein n=1 Tax=Paracoccus sp. TaxID=267 RepID=UPI003A86F484